MTEANIAVIYARVSSHKQKVEANGLSSQIKRCSDYAQALNMSVVATFSDDISGKEIDRPGINEMLAFLKATSSGSCAVIVDDVTRFARNLRGHLVLRDEVAAVGGVLMSPSGQFGQDYNGRTTENMQAVVAEHFREANAEQTRNRQRARLEQGYWIYGAPPSYKWDKVDGQKMIVPKQPVSDVMKSALEDFAAGILETQEEFRRRLNDDPRYPKGKAGKIHKQKVKAMLQNPLYAGYLHLPKWDIGLTKAKHDAIISIETWQRIQDRLTGRAKAPTRKNLSEDFPLRGFVSCTCGTPMRSAWSKGRSKSYAYYGCQNKSCDHYGKSVSKAKIEGGFEALLHRLRPSLPVLKLAVMMFQDIWDNEVVNYEARRKALINDLRRLERDIDTVVARIMETTQPSLIAAYEGKINALQTDKIVLQDKLSRIEDENLTDSTGFKAAYRTALGFLANPCNLWRSERIQDKRAVLKLTFTTPLIYDRKEGYRTMDLSLPFKALQGSNGHESIENYKMVPPA